MNGRSFVVTDDSMNLHFYHDTDSRYPGVLKAPQGTETCRIEPKVYLPVSLGNILASAMPGDASA